MTLAAPLRNFALLLIVVFLYPLSVTGIMQATGVTQSVVLLVFLSIAIAAVFGAAAPYVLSPGYSKSAYMVAMAPMLFLLLSAGQSYVTSGRLFIGDYPVKLIGVMTVNSAVMLLAAHFVLRRSKNDF